MTEPPRPEDVHSPVRWTNWTAIGLVGGLIVLVLVIAYFASRPNGDQDKLTGREIVTSAPSSRAKLCASSGTYDLIKRELFRRAAQVRGSDQAAYDKLAAYAVVRMENPVMESQDASSGAVNCTGSLSLDLPPGVAIVGGRRTLSSDIDYSLAQAADGSGTVVLLRNADAIVTPLATLTRSVQTSPSASPAQITNGTMPEANPPVPAPQSTPTPSAPPGHVAPTARPSFDCNTANSRGELAVCNDPGLAALDRQMTAQYGRAFAEASPDQRALLRDTARRFYAYRDNCPTKACIGDAYTGRMTEIRDIMEGRWALPR